MYQELGAFDTDNVVKMFFESKSLDDLPEIADTLIGDKDAKIGIVLQHGFIGSNLEMLFIGDLLAKSGYRVCLPVLPGHGKDFHELHKESYQNWLTKTEEGIQLLLDEKEDREIILIGHSLGGSLSLIHASKRDDIKAVVTLATPTEYPFFINAIGLFFAKIFGKMKLPYRDFKFGDERLHDHPYVEWLTENYGKVTAYILGEVIKLLRETSESLDKVTVPTLIIASTMDKTIPKDSSYELYRNIKSEIKEVKYFKDSYHIIIADNDKEEVAQTILEFIQKL